MTTRSETRKRHRFNRLLWVAVAAPVLVAVTATTMRAAEEWKAPARAAKKQNPLTNDAAALAAGKQVYAENCLECHGVQGKGDGPSAKDLDVLPSDLSTAMVAGHSDGELFWKITEGRGSMPGYSEMLTDEQRWQVVLFVRSLAAAAEKPASGG